MKEKWIGNEALHKYAETSPPRAYFITQTVKTQASDIKDTQSEWNNADSLTGLRVLQSGGIRITGSNTNHIAISQADTGDAITSLPGLSAATVGVVTIEWFAPNVEATELHNLTARLDPDANGTGVVVTHWRAQLWRVESVDINPSGESGELWDLAPITYPVTVRDTGVVANVTFTFPAIGTDINRAPEFPNGRGGALSSGRPVTVVVIEALNGDGDVAGNVAWIGDAADQTETNNGHIATRYDLLELESQFASETFTRKRTTGVAQTGLPRFQIVGRTYTAQTVVFSSTGNRPNLGNTTGSHELVAEFEAGGGTSVTPAVRVVGGSTNWTNFNDGDTITGLGLTPSTLGRYNVRATLTPSSDSFVTPTVRRLGLRSVTLENVTDQVQLGEATYSMDPDTFETEVPTLDIAFRRDLKDHRSFASELFSDQHAGEIEFRIFYGSTDLARKDWLPIDQFRLNNYDSAGDPVIVSCIHPIALAKQTIPRATTGVQSAIVYDGSTGTQAVYSDLLDRTSMPGRYKGVRLASTNTANISKVLSEPRPMKKELERVAFIEGGAVIPSNGRLKWKRIFTTTGGYAPDAKLVEFTNIEPVSVSPHLDRRIVSYRVPYGWSENLNGGNGGYAGQVWQDSTSAINKLGHAALGSHQDAPTEVSKWLLSDSTSVGSVYADAIARRTIASRKQGMLLLRFQSPTPMPWVELADPASVPTDRFIGRTLETDRALRGQATIFGTVVYHNLSGTEFVVWAPEFDAFLPSPVDTSIDYGLPNLTITSEAQRQTGISGNTQIFERDVIVLPNNDCKSFQVNYDWLRPDVPTAENIVGTYAVNVTTPGAQQKHTVQAVSTGGVPTGDFQYFLGMTSTGLVLRDPSMTLNITPYSSTGATGIAGTQRSILMDAIGQGQQIGVRAQTTTGAVLEGYRVVAGTGITITLSTGGDIVIAST